MQSLSILTTTLLLRENHRPVIDMGLFNDTFNNISVRSWQLVLLVEVTGVLGGNH